MSLPRKSVMLAALVGAVFLLAATGASGQAYSVTFHAGWNLAGAPEGSRYTGADGALYTLQPGDEDYQALPAGSSANGGYGYWVYFPVARTVQMPGGAPFTTVELPPGKWVTVGNPSGFRTVPVTGSDALFTWDPGRGYRAAGSLLPGQGAWAYSKLGGLLTIGVADGGSADGEQRSADIPSAPVGGLDAGGCRTGDVLAGVYHPVRLQVLDSCRTVTGTVTQVRSEPDGDFHINLTPDPGEEDVVNQRNLTVQKGALVIEVIPADQRETAPPLLRDHISVTGAFVLDRDHGWLELHPAWRVAFMSR